MEKLQNFKEFLLENSKSFIEEELIKKFTEETGLKTWNQTKLANNTGTWTIDRLYSPEIREKRSGIPTLNIQLSKGSSLIGTCVIDSTGKVYTELFKK